MSFVVLVIVVFFAACAYAAPPLGLMGSTAATAQFVSGSFAGDGNDDRDITVSGIGQIVALFLKRDAAANDFIARFGSMSVGDSVSLTETTTFKTNCIQSLGTGTFQVGSDTECNGSSATIYYLAIANVEGTVEVDSYTGDGNDNRDISLTASFDPGIFFVAGDGVSTSKGWATTTSIAASAQTCFFNSTACVTDRVQALEAGQFQVGTGATVNTNTIVYHYVAIDASTANIDEASYTGNATDDRSISLGSSFDPDMLFTSEDANVSKWFRFGSNTGDASFLHDAATAANGIQAFSTGSFEVGDDGDVNGGSATYYYWAVGR